MVAPSPRVSIAKPAGNTRTHGVLSIPATATQKGLTKSAITASSKMPLSRLKVVVRRLPPSLTQIEFEAAIGEEWNLGGAKVSWAEYKPGKISKDPTKPSRPARAYLHLNSQEHVNELSEKVRNTSLLDAKSSMTDSSFLGPPSVEFAPYSRVPSARIRRDARQGTIDQDPEFIDFLESLTAPAPVKAAAVENGSDTESKKTEKVTVTPLVQYLRDKKANKVKDVSNTPKAAKNVRQDSKESKSGQTLDKKAVTKTTISSPEKRSAQAVKVEKAARDAVRVLNKQATTSPKPSVTSTPGTASSSSNPGLPLAEKKRERGNASAAARILQRDLGIGTSPGGRKGRREASTSSPRTATGSVLSSSKQDEGAAQAANSTANEASSVSKSNIASLSGTVSEPVASQPSDRGAPISQPPTGPSASRSRNKAVSHLKIDSTLPNNEQSIASLNKSSSTVLATTQAFLKHANPSQGVTEPLLEEVFSNFGTIKKVEIDKKKGFAYIDFADSEALQKAIKASPVKVGQGQVVVLERKTGSSLQARNARGGSPAMGGRGGIPIGPRGGKGGIARGRGGFARGGGTLQGSPSIGSPAKAPTAQTSNGNADAPTKPDSATAPPESVPNPFPAPSITINPTPEPSTPPAPSEAPDNYVVNL